MKRKSVLSGLLTVILVFALSAAVFAADTPIVTDHASAAYEDNGASYILPKDVYVSPQPNTDYYYRIGNMVSVDVFYDEKAAPYGSDFQYGGPPTDGAHVTTIYPGFTTDFGTYVTPEDGYKITIPALAGRPSALYMIAYTDGQPSGVYKHMFYTFHAELVDGTVKVTASAEKAKAVRFYLCVAVYDKNGLLAHVEKSDAFSVSAEHSFDVSDYPREDYDFRVFCWQEDVVPLNDAVSIIGS